MYVTLPLILFAISASLTPGPNNIMIMASGLNYGVRASLPHFFGICLGFPAMFLAIGFGLGYLFERYSLLHEGIQVVGILYLIYLAWLIATAAPSELDGEHSKPLGFVQAALFQWVNPKAWIMGTSAIAAHTTVGADLSVQILTVAFVFWLTTLPSVGIWMVFGVALKRLFANPVHQRYFNIAMALLLVGSMVPVLYDLLLKYHA